MSHSFNELKHTKIADLRKIAAGIDHPAVQGYTQLNKDQLLRGLCAALNIEMHAHHEAKGVDKKAVKAQIQELKVKRAAALQAHDHAELKSVRRKIHGLKRSIRRAIV